MRQATMPALQRQPALTPHTTTWVIPVCGTAITQGHIVGSEYGLIGTL